MNENFRVLAKQDLDLPSPSAALAHAVTEGRVVDSIPHVERSGNRIGLRRLLHVGFDYFDRTGSENGRFTRAIIKLLQDDGVVESRKSGSRVFFHIAQE